MVNQLKNLPHLIGTITNIDGDEIQRSLLSIRAELKKRQELFAQYEVNHIDAYIKKFKAGDTKVALPHLILIVDEFAELKSSQPEFMNELISTARIGRSLGVHLILATQKPSGVVNDQIWSNSKFKLCLKVQSKSDSNEVLKSPLAAEIKEPGRAYLQVGNNEIFQLFQSAYSGAPSNSSEVGNIREYKVYEKDLAGSLEVIYEKKKPKGENEKDIPTQLEAVIDHIDKYCQNQFIEKLPGICLPSLSDQIMYEHVALDSKLDICIPVGIYDDPSNQKQDIYTVDFTQENIFMLGTSQYGKTNFLQVMIKQLAQSYSPKEVEIYILDFASSVLKTYENLKHVGGVVLSNEEEKLVNFFKLINQELDERKEILSDMGLSSYSAYKEAGHKELSQIVVMIDNMTALKELYLVDSDPLLRICREGLSVGISIVMSNSQSNGIPYKYLSNFSRRFSFYCNEKSEYAFLFEQTKMKPENVPGRTLAMLDKELVKVQVYLSSAEEKEYERVEATRCFIEDINRKNNCRAKRIPVVPKLLLFNDFMEQYMEEDANQDYIPIGLNFADVSPLYISEKSNGLVACVNSKPDVLRNFIEYILSYCMTVQETRYYVYIISNNQQDSTYKEKYNIVESVITDSSELENMVAEIEYRFDEIKESSQKSKIIILSTYSGFGNDLANNAESEAKFLSVLNSFKDQVGNLFVYGSYPNERIARSAPELLRKLKEDASVVAFEELSELQNVDILSSTLRQFKKKLAKWEGYYIEKSNVLKIKCVKTEEEGGKING